MRSGRARTGKPPTHDCRQAFQGGNMQAAASRACALPHCSYGEQHKHHASPKAALPSPYMLRCQPGHCVKLAAAVLRNGRSPAERRCWLTLKALTPSSTARSTSSSMPSVAPRSTMLDTLHHHKTYSDTMIAWPNIKTTVRSADSNSTAPGGLPGMSCYLCKHWPVSDESADHLWVRAHYIHHQLCA